METTQLLKYFKRKLSQEEEAEVSRYLANDPDGSHYAAYRDARIIFEAMTIHKAGKPQRKWWQGVRSGGLPPVLPSPRLLLLSSVFRYQETAFTRICLHPIRLYMSRMRRTSSSISIVPEDMYRFPVEGQTINIPVTANVQYSISMEGAQGWLTYGDETKDGIPFTATPLSDGNIRTATVTFTQTDAADGATPVSKSITIMQSKVVITKAPNMKNNFFDITWNNGKNMAALEVLTVEWLMRGDKWKNSANNAVSSILGVEQQGQSYSWLIRVGDIGIGDDQLQIARANGQTNSHWTTGVKFEAGKWYHVALTYNKGTGSAKVYVNGELKAENGSWANATVNLSQYCRISKSYDNSRYIEGCLSEIRVWSVERTAEEIAANMYEYNGDKTNLLGYWRLNEGSGNTVSDHSGHNQTLTANANLVWENISLPEE